MPGRLQGKVAIVTGAATGIGEAIALKFAREGATVAANGLATDPIDDVVAAATKQGGQAAAFPGDVADETAAEAVVAGALERFGRLDVLVNNAGVHFGVSDVADYPIDRFDAVLRNNLRSVFLMTRFALPHLRKTRGVILSAGSEAGYIGAPGNTPYGGTKGFIHAFTTGVAVEQAKFGVRALVYAPGPIETSWSFARTGALIEAMEDALSAAAPLGRKGTTEEVANLVAFLASDEASYMTASVHLVDGGIVAATGSPGRDIPAALRTLPRPTLPLRHAQDSDKA